MGFIEVDNKYYERCGDCGEAVIGSGKSTRPDVCDECWERRGWLVKNGAKFCLDPRFRAIQKSMAGKRGTAKKKIIALQQEVH